MEYIKNFIKGIIVGVATLVPGVSGGTMAIILGIYDNIIHSISSFFHDWKKNIIFLMTVGAGAAAGFLLFSRLMESAVANYPYIMRFLFMGIIIGGLPVLYKKSVAPGGESPDGNRSRSSKSGRAVKITDFLFLVLGFVIVLLMSSEPETAAEMASVKGVAGFLFLLAAGVIIAVALVLPGISGSFMLLVLGLYGVTLNAINTINIPFLIPLALGIAAGTIGTTKIIEKLLARYPGKTYKLIMGFVVGSLIQVYPGIPGGVQLAASIAAFAAGFLVIYLVGRKGLTD